MITDQSRNIINDMFDQLKRQNKQYIYFLLSLTSRKNIFQAITGFFEFSARAPIKRDARVAAAVLVAVVLRHSISTFIHSPSFSGLTNHAPID